MSEINVLIDTLLDDHGGQIYFEQLTADEQRALQTTYIRENEDIIFDIFADVHQTSFADHFASILEGGADAFGIMADLGYTIRTSKELVSVIQGEIDYRQILWAQQQAIETADHILEMT